MARPRKGRAAPVATNCNPTVTPQELAKQLSTKASATRTARVATAKTTSAKRWTTQELQALLDKAREEAGSLASNPRVVVVNKSAGVLHKRMLAAEVKDALDFFTWVFRNWSIVANANRRSKAQQFREQKKGSTEMSMFPNFNELAYRCPYFITFYNDAKCKDAVTSEEKSQGDARVRADAGRRQEAIQARKATVDKIDREREEKRKQEAAQPLRISRRTRSKEVSEDDIPEFREKIWSPK